MADQNSPQPGPPPARPFLDLIMALEDGILLHDADDSVREIVQALAEHQRSVGGKAKGTLTISIGFIDDGKVVEVAAKVDITKPKPIRSRSILYRTRDMTLSRTHPQQMTLPLRDPGDGSKPAHLQAM